jgi:cystathionine beta-lyase
MSQKRKYQADTLIAHLGRNPSAHHGTVNPPVYHASTIIYETLESLRNDPKPLRKGKTQYGRAGTPTNFALEEAIAGLEGGYGALTLPSGLAAIAGAFLSLVKSGDHILVTDAAYYPTRAFCDDILAGFGVEVTYYDPCTGAGIGDLIRANTRLVFTESPGSLTFEVQDIPAIAEVAHKAGALVLMDNTWGSPLFCKPFALGADLSIHAGTKYIVGHSDAMLGLIVTGKELYDRVRLGTQRLGYAAAPDDSYLALRGFRTLGVRLERHQATALRLAEWLQGRPEVARVMHPALPGDPGHALWKRDFTGSSGLFGLVLEPCSDDALAAMLDHMELFSMGYSWGGYESLIIPTQPAKLRSATRWDHAGPSLRIHAGLEAVEDLIADLEAGFARLKGT